MIHLTYSNRTEALLARLNARLAARREAIARGEADPFAPVRLVVPNRNVERYVELGVARSLGIAANLRFERLDELVRRSLDAPLLLGDALLARVLRALLEVGVAREAWAEELVGPELAPVVRYLEGAGTEPEAVELRRVQLAMHVARLFEEYGFSRPELLEAWTEGERRFRGTDHAATEGWQRALFRAARRHPSSADRRTLREAIAGAPRTETEPLHVFGLSYVARVYGEVLDALGRRGDVFLYALNPCEEFWEDVETEGELRRRRRSSDAEPTWLFEDEDPFRLSVDTETPLLRLWGRPGREHVRLLGALTDCDFEPAFVDPVEDSGAAVEAGPLFASVETPPLLRRIQRDVLERAPSLDEPPVAARDGSLQVLACPSVRREVESVAREIWAAIEELDDLTFERIAVLVNGPDRDLYLPHVAAVFEEARDIPFNVTDLSLASVSPFVEAALRLVDLPGTRCTRPEMLGVLAHPAVRPPELDAHAWTDLADRVGIFHGLDARAHASTYAEGRPRLSWDQGLRRVALGAFADAEGFVSVGGEGWLPEAPDDAAGARFLALARSLSSDVAYAREATLPLARWGAFFRAMVEAYLRADDERADGPARAKVLDALGALAKLDLDGAEVRYPIARELAKEALAGLGGSRGQHLADGVVVSSLMPMRAIPFRVIFVLGLGEGRFPASDRRDPLDLRAARRHAGDVTPPERDRYTFLETLLSARERLVLSYVARDERTGEPLAPSAVVTELLEVVERSYLEEASDRVRRAPRLRRHEEPALDEVLPAVGLELAAAGLGEQLRAALAAEGREAVLAASSPATIARRAAAGEPALRRALGLAPLPERPARGPEEATLRLSLGALRRFLDCPLQGWTRVVLRIDEDDVDHVAARADEPFEASALDATLTLRRAFVDAVLEGVAPEDTYAREVARLTARGRWPIGALAEVEAARHVEVLETWRRAWEGLGDCEALARIRLGGAAYGAVDGGGAEAVEDPITLAFGDDPRAPGSGRPLIVELSGRTELLRLGAGARASVVPLMRRRPGSAGRIDQLRQSVRGFFDHVALAALGRSSSSGAGSAHRTIELFGDTEVPEEIAFRPIARDTARGWLRDLVAGLLGGAHAYLLPIEAVLRLGEDRSGDAIVASVEHVRGRGGGQSRYGPVRDPLVYPALDPGRAEEAVAARFGLFFDALEAP